MRHMSAILGIVTATTQDVNHLSGMDPFNMSCVIMIMQSEFFPLLQT